MSDGDPLQWNPSMPYVRGLNDMIDQTIYWNEHLGDYVWFGKARKTRWQLIAVNADGTLFIAASLDAKRFHANPNNCTLCGTD
jgi:hypothetical protein